MGPGGAPPGPGDVGGARGGRLGVPSGAGPGRMRRRVRGRSARGSACGRAGSGPGAGRVRGGGRGTGRDRPEPGGRLAGVFRGRRGRRPGGGPRGHLGTPRPPIRWHGTARTALPGAPGTGAIAGTAAGTPRTRTPLVGVRGARRVGLRARARRAGRGVGEAGRGGGRRRAHGVDGLGDGTAPGCPVPRAARGEDGRLVTGVVPQGSGAGDPSPVRAGNATRNAAARAPTGARAGAGGGRWARWQGGVACFRGHAFPVPSRPGPSPRTRTTGPPSRAGPSYVRVTLRVVGARGGTSTGGRGTCPERPPTLR